MRTLHFVHFQFLPLSSRVLFTMVLLVFATAYTMAMIQIWTTNAGRDGKPFLTARDLMIAYGGNKQGTKLESALRGPMQDMLPKEKRQTIFDWVYNGAKKEDFDARINPIIQEHCIVCHNPDANPHLPNFTSYEGVQKVAAMDKGMTIPTLVRVAHIHLFSITFIFFIVGHIFTHAYVRPHWLQSTLIAVPFAMLMADVGSWYLTKVWEGFAWVVIGSGALMGICFASMWVLSMWQMWFWKLPAELTRHSGRIPDINENY